ncbi:hypothetical protein GS610_18280 [Ruegeria sp. HKCCD6228]|uniref:hypothetical protein n=1 Tax=unclassified Ruegeria TaxID=2625375 RepID=UPI001489CFB2|nr:MULTISPECIES: hypothetical protein [unclassified Ruegeria]NOD99155.1 hypothetical protein [Ruegeria sp. HKCCD6228]
MSDGNYSAVHFEELPLKVEDLRSVPKDSLALFAVTSFAITELNVIARLVLSTFQPSEKDEPVNVAAFIQQCCILRIWTLKLFEFHECIKKLASGKEASGSEVKLVAEYCLNKFNHELQLDRSYSLARDVRHEAAGHYSFSAAKKNLGHVNNEGIASMFVNKQAGNSFYPFGEEVMFAGRLNRHGASPASAGDRNQLIDQLFGWNLKANSWVRACHLKVFTQLAASELSDKFKKESVFWINSEKVGEFSDFRIPLFASRDLGKEL